MDMLIALAAAFALSQDDPWKGHEECRAQLEDVLLNANRSPALSADGFDPFDGSSVDKHLPLAKKIAADACRGAAIELLISKLTDVTGHQGGGSDFITRIVVCRQADAMLRVITGQWMAAGERREIHQTRWREWWKANRERRPEEGWGGLAWDERIEAEWLVTCWSEFAWERAWGRPDPARDHRARPAGGGRRREPEGVDRLVDRAAEKIAATHPSRRRSGRPKRP